MFCLFFCNFWKNDLQKSIKVRSCGENVVLFDGVLTWFDRINAFGEAMGVKIDVVLSIEVPDEKIIARMSGRRVCSCGASYHVEYIKPKVDGICDKCGEKLFIRDDDCAETVANRLKTYHAQTEPLKEFYAARNNLVCVEGQEEVADTTALVLAALANAEA